MLDFTEEQRKTIANGLTILSLAVVVAFVAAAIWGLFAFLSFASAAVVPVVVGFFLALFFKPYYNWWVKTVKNPTLALLALLATVFVPTGLILWIAGSALIDSVMSLVQQAPQLARHVSVWFQTTFPKLHSLLAQMGLPAGGLGDLYSHYGSTALKAGTGALKCLGALVSALVTLLFFIFFLMTKDRRGRDIVSHLPFFREPTRLFLGEQVDAFFDILVSFFQRQAVICLIEGVLYGVGFWAVGLPYGMLIGFVLGVLNLIPLFGSAVCLPIALPIAYFMHGGSLTRVILVLAVWLCGQMLDGYFITPRIQGNKTGLGYAGVIFSFFFWATVLGPVLGMLLAIPLSAFCVVLWRAIKSRYIRPVV